jgi:hypothetical protein
MPKLSDRAKDNIRDGVLVLGAAVAVAGAFAFATHHSPKTVVKPARADQASAGRTHAGPDPFDACLDAQLKQSKTVKLDELLRTCGAPGKGR